MNRRAFLRTTGVALGAVALAGLPVRAQGLEGEDLANLEKALQAVLGKGLLLPLGGKLGAAQREGWSVPAPEGPGSPAQL